MRFETSQQMKMGQHMKLAPRMIQSMEILQMPLAELEERIEQELESNPTLEIIENESDGPTLDDSESAPGERELDLDASGESDFERLDDFEATHPDAAENEYSAARIERPPERDDIHLGRISSSGLAEASDAKAQAMANAPARSASLTDQLLGQWALVDVEDSVRPLGVAIITFLDDDGYLRTGFDEIADRSPALLGDDGVGEADWELALQAVQLLLEPTGVAARDARECLLLQLDGLGDRASGEDGPTIGTPEAVESARVLVDAHLDDLLKNRLPRIASKSGLTLNEINSSIEVLRRLSLAPARGLTSKTEAAIMPDAIIEYDEDEDRYVAYLTDPRTGNLRVNREYALMAKNKSVPRADRDFIKKNLSNAQWLLDAVGQRRHTMLRVIKVVLDEQRDFFDYGSEALKPLPMKLVADRLGVHVATVSRAVSEKYLQTPRGTVPLRGFFTGGLATESGEDLSYDAVKAALKDVVDGEDKSKPFSDEALVKEMKTRGIEVARRTIAKYRSQLDIPSARMRKQF